MRQSLNTLNEQKLELEHELQRVDGKNNELTDAAIRRETQLKEYEMLRRTMSSDTAIVEKLKLEYQQERQRAIQSENQVKLLESRLRTQADQDAIATQISDDAIAELEKQCERQKSQIGSLKYSNRQSDASSVRSNAFADIESVKSSQRSSRISDTHLPTIPNIATVTLEQSHSKQSPSNSHIATVTDDVDEIIQLKTQIETIKTNLEMSIDSENSTLRDEVCQFNVEFESFLSDADQTQTDSFLIGDFKSKLGDIERRLNSLPEV